ncbi:pitrilysin family protein [Porphyromonas catoniae]|uniref:M16 family metallopeptidase n=1 Tax=Porphyromonas catoniae TaxID=41976 RepID=UPI0028D12A6F|nr:pitrilysin family protein [Porphyromonas catoniae]
MHYETRTLASGLRIILLREPSSVAYLGLAIGVGARHESRLGYGLAHSIEHMLFKGTRLRSSTHIIERLESVGAELNAYTTKEETMLYAVLPKRFVHRALHVLFDVVQGSIFPEEEWRKEQEVIIDEIHSYEDSPSELIFDEFEDQVFRGHPLGHAILGTEASVNRIEAKRQRAFFHTHYRPERMVLFAQGDLCLEELASFAEARMTTFGQPDLTLQRIEQERCSLGFAPPMRRVRRRDTSQSHVLLGRTAYSLFDKRRLGLSLLANILGGSGMNARLNMELRERRGLVYHVECNYTPYSDTGLFAVYFGSSHESEREATELVLMELERMRRTPLTDQELKATLTQLRGQLIIASDNREQTFLTMGKTFLHHNVCDTPQELEKRLTELTPEMLHEVAYELFDTETFHQLIYR